MAITFWVESKSSFLVWVELVAGDYSTDKAAKAHLAIVEVEAKEIFGKTDSLRSSDHVPKVFEEV